MRTRLVGAAPILLPLALWLALLPGYGRLQYHDYYGVITAVTQGEEISRRPADWLTARSNEHWVPIPVAIYALNWPLTHGDNRALSALNLAALVGIVLLLAGLLPGEVRGRPARLAVATLVGGVLVLSPTAAHQVVFGFSGTMWLTADLLAVAAVAAFIGPAQRARPPGVALALALGLLGFATYSTNLALWPALIGAAVLLGVPRGRLLAVVLSAAAIFTAYAVTYHRPGHHPSLETAHPGILVLYVLRFLGSPLTRDAVVAGVVGTVLVLLAALPVLTVYRRPALLAAMAPWWALEIYVLGNAAMAAVARSGFGVNQSLEARYLPLATLFTIGVLGGLVTAATAVPRARVALAAVALAGLLAGGAAAARGTPVLRFILALAEQQPAAEWALRHDVHDERVIRSFLPWPTILPPVVPFLRAQGHVPFDRPPDPELSAQLGDRPASTPVAGAATSDQLEPGILRIVGWVATGRDRLTEVVFVDPFGVVRGKAFPGFAPPPDAPRVIGGGPPEGWLGWAASGHGPLRPLVRTARAPAPRWLECAPIRSLSLPPSR